MTEVPRSDEEARKRIAEDLETTVVVEAAAGTGKTTELVNRILAVIKGGRALVREIVAVTFTEKAAGELKLRLREELERERRKAIDPVVALRLEEAVRNLEEAHVSTIHGFCADLLRERPVEARVDPLFRVLTEGQAERTFREAFDAWFQVRLEAPPEGVRRSLRRVSRASRPGDIDEDGPIERLRRAGFDLTQWRDFRAPWTREPFDRDAAMVVVSDLLHRLAAVSAKPSYAGDNLFVDTAPARRASAETTGEEDLDGLEARLIELRKNRDFKRGRKGSGATYGKGVTRAQVLGARDALVAALEDFQVRADADLSAALHAELLECVDQYETLKAREGALDFLDLLLRARNLVKDDAAVRRHFQGRFARIFVDEFQDTDPLQAELLLLLAADDPQETNWHEVTPVPGKLFIVGDPKQSIYRFRRADIGVYQRVCQQLENAGALRLELRRSFRSVPGIQRVINAAFAPVMDGDVETLQARDMPLEECRRDHPGQPAVVALPVPRPYGQRFIAAREIEKSLPDAIGAYVDWLVRESGWTVTERREKERRVPLEARHICLLFRRFLSFGEDMTRQYVEALEARGVRHLLVGGKTFHDREEIETLRAALMAIEWPDDQLSVFATLRGALFAIGDEELLEYQHLHREQHLGGRFHPFRVPTALPGRLEPIREALGLLASLHRQRNRVPAADTISTLLDRTRAHVGFVLRPGGEQALANVMHVAERARQYELDGGMSFRGFVEALRAEASAGHAAEAPILEEGSDGVRLMTVHKAKGLEFPVVILADITARLTPWEAGRYIDADRQLCSLRIGGWSPKDLNDNKDRELRREQREGERVAYVAATRARDLLVVPAVGDEPYAEGWVSPLNAAIYPDADARRTQASAAGCPVFTSRDSVLNRPDGDPATSRTVCPGEHLFPPTQSSSPSATQLPSNLATQQPSYPATQQPSDLATQYSVVWWSPEPAALRLGALAPLGLRRDDLIVRDVPARVLQSHMEAYNTWKSSRIAARDAACVPTIAVMTATEAAMEGAVSVPSDIDVRVERIPGGGERPGGVRFGTLVHALLASVPLGFGVARTLSGSRAEPDKARSTDLLSTLAAAHGRVLGADGSEVAVAAALVGQVLEHPLLRAAATADAQGRCYREAPVTLRLASGALIEGYVDLAYEDESGMVVIDFKTDRELGNGLDEYRRQVQVYAAAIAAATGKSTRAVLLRF